MKSVIILCAAACLSVGATVLVPRAAGPQPPAEQRRLLFEHDVSMYARERGPLDGAPGASAIGFRVSDSVQGGALIVGLDQPVLGVFVGLNTPSAYINAPYQDLSVTFTLADGSAQTVKPAGGGGTAMMFQSPEGVSMSSLRKVALYVDQAAEWAQ